MDLGDAAYRQQLGSIHHAMIGQSAEMVPADRILYALRDVTGTVESIPLICASILSKKLAEGIDALVLDVKCGSGAFMQTERQARELAQSLVQISSGLGKPTTVFITRMEQPLGYAIGNALEVAEVIECLKGQGPEDLMQVTHALAAEMLRLGGLCSEPKEAAARIDSAIGTGSALNAFKALIRAQGGDAGIVDNVGDLPQSAHKAVLYYRGASAHVQSVDARTLGEAARQLCAGRAYADSAVDPAVGIVLGVKVGDRVRDGQVIGCVHGQSSGSVTLLLSMLRLHSLFCSGRLRATAYNGSYRFFGLTLKLPRLPHELIDFRPQVGLVLGSGLGFFADERIQVKGRVSYTDIDGFPVSTVAGHAGRFIYGTIRGLRVLCMQGRIHYYEGYRLQELTIPIRLMKQLGVETVLLTNAAGGIHPDFVPGISCCHRSYQLSG